MELKKIEAVARFLRYYSLKVSTVASSGHPTSSLSAADLMAALISRVFRFDLSHPDNSGNDRLIFSKGHASPLYYSLFAAMGAIKRDDLLGYRKFTSILEGHPTFRFPYAEAATGSLGQGLSIGVGFAINEKYIDKTGYRTFVLLGDGEMAEGSVWEALALASKYKLGHLTGIIDVNRLGQSEQTMLGHDVTTYKKRVESFGWKTVIIDGHDMGEILQAYENIGKDMDTPYMIIAKTFKGRGISFIEDKDSWHGKPLTAEDFEKAVQELGVVDHALKVELQKPSAAHDVRKKGSKGVKRSTLSYKKGDMVATRKAYGDALASMGEVYPEVVVLDGDVKNSTYAEIFKKKFPERFFEMYIAEQNMVGAAVGLARRGKYPFVSTFSAFFTRAYDQIRMSVLCGVGINFCGSHAGVSIGEDGPSQMGLEDLSMFRSIFGCKVLYPSDAVATAVLVEEMVNEKGMTYLRTSRPATPVIYDVNEKFPIGGSKVHRAKSSHTKKVVIVSAGVTLFESLKAQEELVKEDIEVIVVDAYSIKPIDEETLKKLAEEADTFITVEDHWFEGGLGDAVLNVFATDPKVRIHKLAVTKLPRSGKPSELLEFEGISSSAIIKKALAII